MKLASFSYRKKNCRLVNFSRANSLAVAVNDNPAIIAPVNQTDNVVFLPFNDVQSLASYFNDHGHEVAAVITEGIQVLAE
jgi:acetylornithine aminotransferase